MLYCHMTIKFRLPRIGSVTATVNENNQWTILSAPATWSTERQRRLLREMLRTAGEVGDNHVPHPMSPAAYHGHAAMSVYSGEVVAADMESVDGRVY